MKELNKKEMVEDKASNIVNSCKAICYNLVSELSADELLELQIDDYDDFYRHCVMNSLIYDICKEDSDEIFDHVVRRLYLCIKHLNDFTINLSDDMKKLLGRDIFIYWYLEDMFYLVSTLLDYRLSLSSIKLICSYLLDLSVGCDTEIGIWQPMYQCECGWFYPARTELPNGNIVDNKEFKKVCCDCGRFSDDWELVSARYCYLIKRRKRWIFGIFPKVEFEKINIGAEKSKFKSKKRD